MTSARRGIALAAIALVVVGCSSTGSATSPGSIPPIQFIPKSAAPDAASAPSDDQGSAESGPEGDQSADGESGGSATRCSNNVQAAVDTVVSKQLAAFKSRDFDAAFALASEQFRAITNAEGLKALILRGHSEVADSASHEFTDCRQANPDLVLAAVSVTGENGKTVLLVYQFTMEEGSWHILQSAPMDGHGGGSDLASDPGLSGEV
jgi:hypothetical protein